MSNALSKNDLCNQALSLIRERAVALNIEEPKDENILTDTERALKLWYDTARKECLTDTRPTLAIRRVILNEDGDYKDKAIANHRYRLPSDLLEVLGLTVSPKDWVYAEMGETELDYTVEDNYVYTGKETGVNLRYLQDKTEFSSRDTKFLLCLVHYIAYYISAEIQNGQQIQQYLQQLKEQKKMETRNYYLRQVKPAIVKENEWRRRP
jgi:hypothetical protein